ncbi:MAG: response regulator [Methanomassiliicoccales archaeon]|nr:response regulator [Methanomassiliicoccales archaeon]TFG54832.1 MAG: response regulator [Methanomassiliicoccus sp.]
MGGKVKLSVLMVEDNIDHVDLCREHMPPEEFDLFIACNGAECLAAIKSRPYDVVLLDYFLPDTNGMDLLPRVREFQPNAFILFVSVLDDPDLSYQALRAGASDYMVKGFGYFRTLRDRIRESMEE